MKTIALQSGKFTAAGNFTGKNAAGANYHVPAAIMESVGYTAASVEKEPIKFPLYAIVVERTFNTLDSEGNPTEETFTRSQAGSVFKTKEAMIEAFTADRSLEIEATASLAKTAVASGLTEAQLSALLLEA